MVATLTSTFWLSMAATASSVPDSLRIYFDLSPSQARRIAEHNQQFLTAKSLLEARRLRLFHQLHAVPPALTSDPGLRASREREVTGFREQIGLLDHDLLTRQQAVVRELQGLLTNVQLERLDVLRTSLFSDPRRCEATRVNLLPSPGAQVAGYRLTLAESVGSCAVFSQAAH